METQQDDRQPPSFSSERRVCHWCGYDNNPLTNEYCDVCDRPLDRQRMRSRYSNLLQLGFLLWVLSFGGFVLLVGGIYGLLRNPPSLPSPSSSSPPATVAPTISRASDIRLYRTIQEVPNIPKGLFNYHNALPFAAIMAKGMDAAIARSFPEFQLRYTEPRQGNPGSGAAIRMLIDGEISIATSSRPLEDAEFDRARERNFTLEQIPVAIDGPVFCTHPSVSIPGLSLDQAQAIYSGKITNWKELGGPDVPIVPLSLDPVATATPKQVLGNVAENMGQTVRIVRNNTEAIRIVSSTPGAIHFAGGATIIGQKTIRILRIAKAHSNAYVSPITETGEANKQAFRDGTYPLTRRLFVIVRRDGTFEEQAGVAYANFLLSEEGQRIIESAGFVSLY